MTQGVEMLPVEQSDRDMAASVLPPHVRDEVVRGEHDNEGVCSAVVQAFARHRLSTHSAATGSVPTQRQVIDAIHSALPRSRWSCSDDESGTTLTLARQRKWCVDAVKALYAAPPTPDAAAEALRGITDDFMTSEAHHPGYVLIPTAKFEQLRAAAETLDAQ